MRVVDDDGDDLVLFQTRSAEFLRANPIPPEARAGDELFDYRDGMVSEVFDALTGDVVTCGSFVGRYQPA